MKRRFAALGAALATATALVVLVGSTAFAQVPGGYGYGPSGYGSGGYGSGTGGYGMMGRGMIGGGMMGGYYGWGQAMGQGMMGGYHGGWDW